MLDIKKILNEIITEEFSSKLVDINHDVNSAINDFNGKYKLFANKGLYRLDCYIFLNVTNPDDLRFLNNRLNYKFGVKTRDRNGYVTKNQKLALYSLYFYSEKSDLSKNKVSGVYLMPSYNSKHGITNDKIYLPNFNLDDIYKNGLNDNDRLVKINLNGKKLKITNSKYFAIYNKTQSVNGGQPTYVVKSELDEDFYIWIDNIVKYEDKDIIKNK